MVAHRQAYTYRRGCGRKRRRAPDRRERAIVQQAETGASQHPEIANSSVALHDEAYPHLAAQALAACQGRVAQFSLKVMPMQLSVGLISGC